VKLTRHLPLLILLLGCGPKRGTIRPTDGPTTQVPDRPTVLRVMPRSEGGPVEVGGIAPDDTTLRLRRGESRVVVLRHGPPDRAEFLELQLPATVFADATREQIQLTIRTVPGVYGAEVSADVPWGPGATIAFKYAVHFYPPAEAVRKYRTLTEIDRRLVIGRREQNGDHALYYTTRPAPDVVRAMIPGEGTYVMVVGK
jgi:hypothetical protein